MLIWDEETLYGHPANVEAFKQQNEAILGELQESKYFTIVNTVDGS